LNLNHIFLFLAIASPLLVLARAWRPSAPYHGWRLAALVVLAVTAVAWLFWPDGRGGIWGGGKSFSAARRTADNRTPSAVSG